MPTNRPADNSSAHRGTSKLERLGIIVAVITGIGGFIISAKTAFFAPKPPRLEVIYSVTKSQSISVAPHVRNSNSKWTDPFPFPLMISNTGDKTAEDVYLRIIHPRNVKLISNKYKFDESVIFGPGDGRIMSLIRLGNLNPSEKRRIDTDIFILVENTTNFEVDAVTKDKVAITVPISMVLTYNFEIGIGAKDVKENTSPFYLKIGSLTELTKREDVIFRADTSGYSLLERERKNVH